MDSQIVEIIGRNRLVNELLEAGFEVALPIRDRGIDLIVYVDIDKDVNSFIAVPIQMKASSSQSFVINKKYEKFHDLIFAFVWGLGDGQETNRATYTYALTYKETCDIAKEMEWTNTRSWQDKGEYATTNPSEKLRALLEPHRMDAKAWKGKIIEAWKRKIKDVVSQTAT